MAVKSRTRQHCQVTPRVRGAVFLFEDEAEVQGLGFRVQGLGFRLQGLGFRV